MNIDGVEADDDPKRLSELERQRLKTKWLAEAREKREINEGENDEKSES